MTLLDLSFVDEDDEQSCFKSDVRPLSIEDCTARCRDVLRRISSRCKGFIEVSTIQDFGDQQEAYETSLFDVTEMANSLGDEVWHEDSSKSLGQSQSYNSFHGNSVYALTAPHHPVLRAGKSIQEEGKIRWVFCAACRHLPEKDASELCIGLELLQCGWNTRTLGYSGKLSAHLYNSMIWSINTRRHLGLQTVDRHTGEGKRAIATMILKLHDMQYSLENGCELPRNLVGYEWDGQGLLEDRYRPVEQSLAGQFGQRIRENTTGYIFRPRYRVSFFLE